MSFHWKCPYCNHDTTILNSNFSTNDSDLLIDNKQGKRKLRIEWVVCPNDKCKEYTLQVILYPNTYNPNTGRYETGKILNYWDLVPPSDAKVFPDYVPKAIIQDYEEACAVKI